MSDPPKTPPELDAIARVVLAYKPKAKKAKIAKKRKKAARRASSKPPTNQKQESAKRHTERNSQT